MRRGIGNVEELVGYCDRQDHKTGRANELASLYAEHSIKSGSLTADLVRSYAYLDNKLYFKSFCILLERAYPDKKDIIEGLLGIKSHGIGFRLKKEILDEGMRQFPPGYLDLGAMPAHTNAPFTVVVHGERFPIETFPTRTFQAIENYLRSRGADVRIPTKVLIKPISAIYKTLDVEGLLLERSRESETVQRIDDYDYPLDEDILEYIKKSPSVLFEACDLKDRLVIAIPGIVSNHCTSNRGYFNAEAILAVHLAEQGKKVVILDLDASFADGTTQICLGREGITLIGIQTDPHIDATINYRNQCQSQKNSIQFNLEPGLNGRGYMKALEQAAQAIPKDADVLIISFGTNIYAFDSVGLQCVEEKYLRPIGEAIGRTARTIKKIIITPAGGYEDYAPQLFTEFCIGVRGAL